MSVKDPRGYWRRGEEADWPNFDALKQIAKIVLTNRDHVRETKVFQTRYVAHLVAGRNEVTELAPLVIDEPVHEGDLERIQLQRLVREKLGLEL